MTDSKKPRDAGRFAYEGLERALHEKARLGMMTSLMAHPEGLLFGDLKELCTLTDGNLNRHLKVLQEEGLVEIWKGTVGHRSQTLCRMTREGRKRFMEYIEALEAVIADAAAAAKAARSPSNDRSLKGFSLA
ncbi:MAG: transcriptional regulator [Planctomycetes bacterium]|nr:transcriptional regulator [Planctomycetota bacterium]